MVAPRSERDVQNTRLYSLVSTSPRHPILSRIVQSGNSSSTTRTGQLDSESDRRCATASAGQVQAILAAISRVLSGQARASHARARVLPETSSGAPLGTGRASAPRATLPRLAQATPIEVRIDLRERTNFEACIDLCERINFGGLWAPGLVPPGPPAPC